MSYKTEEFCRLLPNLHKQKGVNIIAKNGAVIAECKTQSMADKIIKGLGLYEIEEIKRKNFRI